jgi:hypothetical protein
VGDESVAEAPGPEAQLREADLGVHSVPGWSRFTVEEGSSHAPRFRLVAGIHARAVVVDRRFVAEGSVPANTPADAIARYGIDPVKPEPTRM